MRQERRPALLRLRATNTLPLSILPATGGSEEAKAALLAAVRLTRRADSELYVVHAWTAITHYEAPLSRNLLASSSKLNTANVSSRSVSRTVIRGSLLYLILTKKGGKRCKSCWARPWSC